LFRKDGGLEVFFEDVETALEMRVERASDVDALATLVAAFEELKVARYCATLLVVHEACALVANPGVGSTATGVDPEDMRKAKVFAQCDVDDFYGHCNERPTPVTDRCAGTACTDIVVIRHIDIKDQLLHERAESAGFAEGFAIAWICAVHGTDLETRR
jgi:hypothetical protein